MGEMSVVDAFDGLFKAFGFPEAKEKPEHDDLAEAELAVLEAVKHLRNVKTKKVADIIKAMDEAKIEDDDKEEKTTTVVGDLSSTITSAVAEGITSLIRSGALTEELRKALGMNPDVPKGFMNAPTTASGVRNVKEAEVPVTPKATSAKVPPKAKSAKTPEAV